MSADEKRLFGFAVTGTEYNPYPSTLPPNTFEQVGTVEAEHAAPAIQKLVMHVLEWDMLDGDEEVTLTIRPQP